MGVLHGSEMRSVVLQQNTLSWLCIDSVLEDGRSTMNSPELSWLLGCVAGVRSRS